MGIQSPFALSILFSNKPETFYIDLKKHLDQKLKNALMKFHLFPVINISLEKHS